MRSRVTVRRVKTPYKPEPKVHSRGTAPTPERAVVVGSGRVLQGGLPPVPYRAPWARAGLTGRGAREPFASPAVKAEFYAAKRDAAGDPMDQ